MSTIAPARYHLRINEKGGSRGCERGPSNKKSYKKFSYNISPDGEAPREVEVETGVLRQRRARRSSRFLRGPIPVSQITTAARLPGKALALLLAVHHQIALTGKDAVTVPAGLLTELGVGKDAKTRGLRELEQAGLVDQSGATEASFRNLRFVINSADNNGIRYSVTRGFQ
jgi:hypothetical protein